MKRTKA
jgi:hypothetical protein